MKARQLILLAALFVMAVTVALAAPANKKTIKFSEPTTVGSFTLKPGEYTVEWNGSGPDVQVSFSQSRNTIVTVPATLEAAQNQYDLSYAYNSEQSGACSLSEIRTKHSTLRFAPRDGRGGE